MTLAEIYEQRGTVIGYWLFYPCGSQRQSMQEWDKNASYLLVQPLPTLHNCCKWEKSVCRVLKLLGCSKLRLWFSALWQRSFTADFLYSRSGLAVEDCTKRRQTHNYKVRKLRRQRRRSMERENTIQLTKNLVFPVTVTWLFIRTVT
jgi:hypothetical protein